MWCFPRVYLQKLKKLKTEWCSDSVAVQLQMSLFVRHC